MVQSQKKIEEKKWKTDKNKRNILSLDTFQRATTNSVDMFMAGVGVGFLVGIMNICIHLHIHMHSVAFTQLTTEMDNE